MAASTSFPIRVLLIDDHEVLRAGLSNLLALQKDLLVVGQASSGEEGVQIWRSAQPHVGLVDVSLGGMDGVETVRRILAFAPQAKLVMLTSSESALDATRSLDAGAVAYVTKHSSPREIVEVIREVYAGHLRIRRGVRPDPAPAEPKILSERELSVLKLMRQGSGNAEIGRKLGIAERTVKCHVTAIFAKVGAQDRAGAVARGFDLGLLTISKADQSEQALPRSGSTLIQVLATLAVMALLAGTLLPVGPTPPSPSWSGQAFIKKSASVIARK